MKGLFQSPLPIALLLPLFLAPPSCLPGESRPNSDGETPGVEEKKGAAERIASLIDEKNSKGWNIRLHVATLEKGEEVLSMDGDVPGNPASLIKIITGAAALKYLGKGFSFETTFSTDSPLREDGSINNLYIKGKGDPHLLFEKCYAIARNLKALGLKRIEGDIIGDDSFFDSKRGVAGWIERDPEKEERPYNSPISALSVNFNAVSIIVNPVRAGAPAIVNLETPGSYVEIRNEMEVLPGDARGFRGVRLEYLGEGGRRVYRVSGSLPEGSPPRRFFRIIDDPPLHASFVFRELLAAAGIEVSGKAAKGISPPLAHPLLTYPSPPLPEIVAGMNKFSNNFTAEMVLKRIGAELYGPPGTTEKGVRALYRFLEESGIDTRDVKIVNGSGLSARNSISPKKMVRILCLLYRNFRDMPELLTSLPISGIDGTLKRLLADEEIKGRIRGKTGFLSDALNICGFAETNAGRVLTFALFINRFPSYREGNEIRKRVSSLITEL